MILGISRNYKKDFYVPGDFPESKKDFTIPEIFLFFAAPFRHFDYAANNFPEL